MKMQILAFLCGALLLTSCTKQDNLITPVSSEIAPANVPSLVLASMSRNYPAVTDVTWRQTAPTTYTATFRQNSAARTATFEKTGTLLKAGDVIDPATLPAAITDYLATNYPGYVLVQADVKKDAAGAVKEYETLITLNNVQYELEFNAVGVFTKLETPDGHEQGNGLAVSALPKVITDYLTANYPGYTFREAESHLANGTLTGYEVEILQNGQKIGLDFDAAGTFVGIDAEDGKHDGQKDDHDDDKKGSDSLIAQSALPAPIGAYLTATYPGYVFVKAQVEKNKTGNVTGYDVKFTLAGKSHEAEFDAAGKFIKLDD